MTQPIVLAPLPAVRSRDGSWSDAARHELKAASPGGAAQALLVDADRAWAHTGASTMTGPSMSNASWQRLVAVLDELSAQALAERLQIEGVPARIDADTPLLGAARRCHILVPAGDVHRAREILGSGGFSEEELTFLATGEAGADRSAD